MKEYLDSRDVRQRYYNGLNMRIYISIVNLIGAITLNDFNLCTKQSIGTPASIFKEWSHEDAIEHSILKSDLVTV